LQTIFYYNRLISFEIKKKYVVLSINNIALSILTELSAFLQESVLKVQNNNRLTWKMPNPSNATQPVALPPKPPRPPPPPKPQPPAIVTSNKGHK
jgi:hypothetical protein